MGDENCDVIMGKSEGGRGGLLEFNIKYHVERSL